MPTSFSEAEKEQELDRLLKSRRIKKSKNHVRILKGFWDRGLKREDPWPQHEAGLHFFPPDKNVHTAAGPEGTFRSAAAKLRSAIRKCYVEDQVKQPGEISAALKSSHGYYLDFEPFASETKASEIAERFWKQIYQRVAKNSKSGHARVNIFFSNESVNLPDGTRPSGPWKDDEREFWTGTGEVCGCFVLGQLFARINIAATVRRSTELTHYSHLDDQLSIFVGSSLGMPHLYKMRNDRWLKGKQHYFFQWGEDGRIEILEKSTGKLHFCQTEDPNDDLAFTDFGLISFFYNEHHNQALVGLAGISTLGTEQVVRDACGQSPLLEGIAKKLNFKLDAWPEFDALIAIEIDRHLPEGSSLLDAERALLK